MKFFRVIPVVREIVVLVLWIVDEIRARRKRRQGADTEARQDPAGSPGPDPEN